MKISELKHIVTKVVKEMSGTSGGTTTGGNITGGPEGEQTFTRVTVKKMKREDAKAPVEFEIGQEVNYNNNTWKILAKNSQGLYLTYRIEQQPSPNIKTWVTHDILVRNNPPEVVEVKDVEPKLAAGKVKNNYYVTHFGYTPAPSIPNRKSKAMDYKQLFELNASEYFIQIKNVKDVQNVQNIVIDDNLLRGKFKNRGSDVYITSDLEAAREFIDVLNQNGIRNVNNVEDYTDDLEEGERTGNIHIATDTKTDSDIYFNPTTGAFSINIVDAAGNRWNKLQVNTIDDVIAKFPALKWTRKGIAEFQPEDQDTVNTLSENYSQFRNKTSKRDAPEQLHKAVKEIKKKLQEVDRLVEYTNRLRTEVSEGEGEVKYNTHTTRALEQIQEMIKHTYIKAKKLK